MLEYPHTDSINDFVKSRVKQFDNQDYDFIATIKIHGSNTGICINPEGGIWFQSRNRVLTPSSDHADFAKTYENNREIKFILNVALALAKTKFDTEHVNVAMYGEWCGGEIQKHVALTDQPKEWIIFDIAVFSSLKPNDTKPIYFFSKEEVQQVVMGMNKTIYDFPHYNFKLNFFKMGDSINEIAEKVLEIEKECPVAKQLHGVSGIGEGLYFKCHNGGNQLFFKAKGQLHAGTSKVSTVKTNVKNIDVNQDLLGWFGHERLTQGVHYLHEMNLPIRDQNYKTFLNWVIADVEREGENWLTENNVVLKEQMRYVGGFVRKWWEDNSLLV